MNIIIVFIFFRDLLVIGATSAVLQINARTLELASFFDLQGQYHCIYLCHPILRISQGPAH